MCPVYFVKPRAKEKAPGKRKNVCILCVVLVKETRIENKINGVKRGNGYSNCPGVVRYHHAGMGYICRDIFICILLRTREDESRS